MISFFQGASFWNAFFEVYTTFIISHVQVIKKENRKSCLHFLIYNGGGWLMQEGAIVGCLFSVHLVQFHDAPWTLSSGAAVNAAEAEAATWTRHHEPTALRPRWQPLQTKAP